MKGEVTLRKRIIYKQINTFLARIEKMCVDIQLLDIYQTFIRQLFKLLNYLRFENK